MQSWREGLIPFPHADLLSLIDKSRDKINIFPLVRTLQAIHQAYALASLLQPTYIEICARKSKLNVGFPCYDRKSIILGLPYIGNVPTRPFSFILKAINNPIPSYGKGERIQL
jgi:hypothetical protein